MIGIGDSNIEEQTNWNGVLYFAAETAVGNTNRRIWKVNTARTGVETVGGAMTNVRNLVASGNWLCFVQRQAAQFVVCKMTNGVYNGVQAFPFIPGGVDVEPRNLIIAGGRLYFTATDAVRGRELWRSNAVCTLASPISDIIAGPESSGIDNLVNLNGVLHFTASTGTSNGDRVYRFNAAPVGVVAEGDPMQHADNLVVAGSRMYFTQISQTASRPRWSATYAQVLVIPGY